MSTRGCAHTMAAPCPAAPGEDHSCLYATTNHDGLHECVCGEQWEVECWCDPDYRHGYDERCPTHGYGAKKVAVPHGA